MNADRRRSTRLPRFDYTRQGAYFVTLCALNRACLFGEILNGEMRLREIGPWDVGGNPDPFPARGN